MPLQSTDVNADSLLLVSCYESGFQPLGLALPAAALHGAGVAARFHDLALAPISDSTLRAARCLAVSAPMHTALRLGLRLARRARALNPRIHIVFYGLYARIQREHLLPLYADAVIAEDSPTALLAHLVAAGLVSAAASGEQQIPRRVELAGLERYAKLRTADGEALVASMSTSHGCRYRCRHCPVPVDAEGKTLLVPKDALSRDIEAVVAQGAEHISFTDPDFLNHPEHSLGILRAMHRTFPGLSFDFTARVGHLLAHSEQFPEWVDMGCAFVVSAVEILNDRILKLLTKGHTAAQVRDLLRRSERAGLALRPTLLPFTPWSSPGDIVALFELVERESSPDLIDPVQLSIRLLVPAHSLLLSEPTLAAQLGDFDPQSMSYPWRHPDPRMDRLQAALQARVAQGIEAEESDQAVYLGLRDLVRRELGELASSLRMPLQASERPRPRLSEPWFC